MKRRSPRRLAVVLAALLALLAVVLAAAWQLTPRPARTLTLQVTSARGSSHPGHPDPAPAAPAAGCRW